MKYYRFPENRITKAAFGLFLFAMLYLARDTLTTSAVLGFYKAQFLMLGIIGVAGIMFLWVNRKNLKGIVLDKRMAAVLLCGAVLLLPMAAKRDWQMMYFSILICVYFAIFLTYFMTLQEVAKFYVVILAVLGAYTVVASYLFRIPADAGIWPVPVVYNQRETSFYYFFPAYVPILYVKNRNFGIFREPGVYQYFLLLGLYLTNYVVSWKKKSHLWTVNVILMITMLTTLATGGVIEMGLLALVVFFDKKLYRNKWVCGVLLAAFAMAAIVVAYCAKEKNVLYWELYDMLIGKFVTRQLSVTERMEAVFVNLRAILANPLFGGKIAEVLHAIENNTTSTLVMFAISGLGGGILHVAGWIALVWRKEQKLWVNLALLVIVFMSFNTQNLTADVFFWLFPMMALTERGLPLLKKGKV